MTTFFEDEKSAEDSQPREFYEIVQSSAVTYRIASGVRDISYGGNTYKAAPAARTEITVDLLSAEAQLTLALACTHPLVERFFSQGSPPRQISVRVFRMQLRSGEVEEIWAGIVTSVAFDSKELVAKFAIPSRFHQAVKREIPGYVLDRDCPYILYDKRCRVNDGDFSATSTIAGVNGRSVRVVAVPAFSVAPLGDNNVSFAVGGDITHVATGERQTIFTQSVVDANGNTTFDMQAPIPEMKAGDTVVVRAGCRHSVISCQNKFANIANYGGMPFLPSRNIFLPTGWGVRN